MQESILFKAINFIMFICVWAVLYATYALLGYYHDDYAYAGLTYYYTTEGLYSERLNFSNYINYLYHHYMGWGGRVTALGIAIPFLHAGPSVFWFVQSLIITCILYIGAYIASMVTSKNDFPQTLIFFLVSHISIKITLARDGLYWGAASLIYVWPMFFLLCAIVIINYKKLNKIYIVFISFLLFISSSSSESYAIYTFVFVVINLLLNINKRRIIVDIVLILSSLVGLLFCFLAPGNLERAKFTGQYIPDFIDLINNIPGTVIWIIDNLHLFYAEYLFVLAAFSVCFYVICILKNKNKIYLQIFPFIFAGCATMSLLILPFARSPRVFMPFILTLPIVTAPAVNVIIKNMGVKKLFFLGILLWYGLSFYIPIWKGYFENYTTIVENDNILSSYKNGNYIILKKLPQKQYANDMPYDQGKEYIEMFMKQYYDIPKDVLFIFR